MARVEILIVDDFLLRPLNVEQTADTLEVIEDRAGLRSTIITSQLPVARWHEGIGDVTMADALLDRLCQNLHRFELKDESMRATSPERGREIVTLPPARLRSTTTVQHVTRARERR